MSNHWPWSVLGIAETDDKKAIRKAYSAQLKTLDLDQQIAEYADLRDARDEALWLADNREDEGDFGLGTLDDEGDASPADHSVDDEGDFEWEIAADELLPAPEEPRFGGDGFARQPAPSDTPDGWADLTALIFPNGEYSAEAFTLAEADEADAALSRMIDWAEEGDLARHGTLDYNLADMLAGGWPRSAPVVDKANTAFHWLGEAGGLDERPAVQFLNARTEGMRFHDAVQAEDHPLHKAWMELSKPGKASWIDRLKIKHDPIHELLSLIRQRFPELESLLDAERIESWETPSSDVVSYLVQRLFILFLVVQVLRLCAGMADEREPLPQPLSAEEQQAIQEERKDAIAAALFGEGFAYDQVTTADPAFAAQLDGMIEPLVRANVLDGRLARPLVRSRMLAARERADFETLLAIQALHLEWLKSGQEAGGNECEVVLNGRFSGGLPEVDSETLAQERNLARDMLEKKLLTTPSLEGEVTFQIPGWLVDAARNDSGFSSERFREILQDPEDSQRCEVQIALIENMLSAPSRVPIETLRGL